MRRLPLSYLFVALVASCFAAGPDCHAQVRLNGQVIATDECQLAPLAATEACTLRVVPIQGEVSLRRVGSAVRFSVLLDSAGNFSKKLPAGRYAIRLANVRAADRALRPSRYQISPSQFNVTARQIRGPGYVRYGLFTVSHRSRVAGAPVGISDGLLPPS